MENNKFKKIGQFQYSSEAYIYKGKLESEGIEVFVRDNHTVDTDPLISNAIGGVKLFVRVEDYAEAMEILSEMLVGVTAPFFWSEVVMGIVMPFAILVFA